MDNELKLEDLGYNEFFESARKNLKLEGFSVARVIAEYKGAYRVKNVTGEYLAKITGKQMFEASSRADYPAVGDWVAITDLGEEQAVIHKILPRKTLIKRKYSGKNEFQIIAANIDVAFIIESVGGDYNLNRFERYLAIANDGGVKPAIILNKTDLIPKEELEPLMAEIKTRFSGIDFIPTSTITDGGLDELKSYLAKGKTYCFLGSSGVGKSSLINKLIGKSVINTKKIDPRTDRGKHTTTAREMYFLENGSIVIDNPGMREVGMANASTGINNVFDEIIALAQQCKFADCSHTGEPGCKVLAAIESGKLEKEKYDNYANLKKETEYYEKTKLEKKQKDRQFGKFVKTAKEQLKHYGHKDY
ncbi:MAG: ribosome small subunit-dependent GTPase A [Candidatus Nealsonbacteria bacterium]|nr:ribosome small subunit-dependent GTPase A [Candidatus Nealsonbacteria bacterium]